MPIKSAFILLIIVFSSGCSMWNKGGGGAKRTPFQLDDALNPSLVSLKKGYLDREFIVKVNAQQNGIIPNFHALASRIVRFEVHGHELAMIQSPQGLQKTESLQQSFPIFTFPILSQDSNTLVFDLSSGLDRLYILEAATSDPSSHRQIPDSMATASSLDLLNQTTKSSRIANNGGLDIHQSAIVDLVYEKSYLEIFYRLEIYEPNENFASYENQSFETFGFFESQAYYDLANRRSVSKANRFDITEPVHFYISSNTPVPFRKAIEEGVLYWNKALGKEVLSVHIAPEGLTAPDFDKNVIQWVDAPSAAFAYADWHADPRTGETTNAHIFLGSGLLFNSYNNLKSSKNAVRESSHGIDDHPKKALAKHNCSHFHAGSIDRLVKATRSLSLTDSQLIELLADTVRMIVAHEVGHVLGLRHNFAGSLASEKSVSESFSRLKEVVEHSNVSVDETYSSTVMDYLPTYAVALIGKQVAHRDNSLIYDQMAIRTLYFGEEYPEKDWPQFCTDQHADQNILNCRRFDLGGNPLSTALDNYKSSKNWLATMIPELFISELYYRSGRKSQPIRVDIDPEWIATSTMSPLKTILAFASDSSFLLQTKLDTVFDPRSRRGDKDAFDTQIAKTLEELGGWDEVFPVVSGVTFEQQKKRALDYVQSEDYRSYGFTDEQIKSIEAFIEEIFPTLELLCRKEAIRVLSEYENIRKGPVGNSFADFLLKSQARILYSADESMETLAVIADPEKDNELKELTLTLPAYKYSFEERLIAAGMISAKRGEEIDWAFKEKSISTTIFANHIDKVLQDRNKTSFDLQLQESDFSKWLLEAQKIESLLNMSQY